MGAHQSAFPMTRPGCLPNSFASRLHSLRCMAPDVRPLLDALQQQVHKLEDDEDNIELLEDLLGVAFVAAQAHMTWVVRQVKDLYASARRKCVTIDPLGGEKEIDFGDKGLANGRFTTTRAIHELANYFKHGDAWPTFDKLDKDQRWTCEVLAEIGALTCGDFGIISSDLRFGARAVLGSMTNINGLATSLDKWRTDLANACEQELKRQGLLTAPKPEAGMQ